MFKVSDCDKGSLARFARRAAALIVFLFWCYRTFSPFFLTPDAQLHIDIWFVLELSMWGILSKTI